MYIRCLWDEQKLAGRASRLDVDVSLRRVRQRVTVSDPHFKTALPHPVEQGLRAPKEIRLSFNEKIEARVSKVDVITSNGAKVDTEPVRADTKRSTDLVVNLPALQPGRYRVQWRAISVDTHAIQGNFEFEIKL